MLKKGFPALSQRAGSDACPDGAAFATTSQDPPPPAVPGWLKPLLHRLEVMSGALAVDVDTDFAELCLSSCSSPAVCVFRRNALRTGHVQALFRDLRSGRDVEDFLWVVLAGTPAERHAVRLSLDGKLSVFFKTDIPTQHISRIAAAVGLDELIAPAARYFEETGRTASGIAWELGDAHSPRLRLYDNVTGFRDFASTAALSPLLPRDYLDMLRGLSGDDAALPSVLNLSVTREGLSVKVEAPDVLLKDPHRADLSPREQALFAAARGIVARCGMARLNYLGLRFRGASREVSCYLDGFRASQMK